VITIKTKLLAAIARWAINYDEQRPHLHMVLFTKREIVACDGRRLVRVPIEYACAPFGVDRDHLLAAVAAQQSIGNRREISIQRGTGSTVAIEIGNGVILTVPIRDPATFPPYEKIMPKRDPVLNPAGYGFQPEYLAGIHEVNREIAVGEIHGVRVTAWGGPLDAMLFEGAMGSRYVIMPVRT
jgi:hypothetical protein